MEKGKIISQSPKAGKTVRTNEPVRIVISKGPEMVQIPELVYLTKDQALRRLEKAGLVAELAEEYSEQAAAGLVIRQSAQEGTKAAKGSSVKITVSLGKAPVQTGNGSGSSSGNTGGSGTGAGSGSGGSSSSGGQAGGSGGTGGSSGGSGSGSTGGSGGSGDSTGGSGSGSTGSTGGSGGSTGSTGGSSGSGNTGSGGSSGGNKAIMPDGGSFVVE